MRYRLCAASHSAPFEILRCRSLPRWAADGHCRRTLAAIFRFIPGRAGERFATAGGPGDNNLRCPMRRLGSLLLILALWAGSAPPGSAANTTAAVQAEVERALARLVRLDPSQGLSYAAIEVV